MLDLCSYFAASCAERVPLPLPTLFIGFYPVLENMKIRILLLIGALAAVFCMCDPDGDSRVVGDVFTDNKAVLGYVDSFSLKLSTIRLDSFVTTGNSNIFMGYYQDEKVGNVLAETYMPIVFSTKTNIPEDAVYDSLVICFKPSGGWIGDTLQPKEIKIYEVLEEIKPHYRAERQQMFNHQKLQRSDNELATVSIDPFPARGLVSWARMSDSLGQLWFDMIVNGDDAMDKDEYFEEYFKGICIVPQTTNCTWGLDFLTFSTALPESDMIDDATQSEIRLYYRKPGDDEYGSYMTFVPKESNPYRYVYFENDRSGTPFDSLQIDGGKVYSSESEHVSYIQTGSGLALRIDFPTLSILKSASEYMSVVDAQLLIKPKDFSYDETYQLPSTLYLAVTDESNDLLVNLTDMSGQIVQSPIYYTADDKQPYYLFSAVKFVRSFINQKADNSELSMALIVLPSDLESASTFKRLVVDDNTRYAENVQLQIYYVTY